MCSNGSHMLHPIVVKPLQKFYLYLPGNSQCFAPRCAIALAAQSVFSRPQRREKVEKQTHVQWRHFQVFWPAPTTSKPDVQQRGRVRDRTDNRSGGNARLLARMVQVGRREYSARPITASTTTSPSQRSSWSIGQSWCGGGWCTTVAAGVLRMMTLRLASTQPLRTLPSSLGERNDEGLAKVRALVRGQQVHEKPRIRNNCRLFAPELAECKALVAGPNHDTDPSSSSRRQRARWYLR